MITVLVVAERDRAGELDRLAADRPSLELLHATDVEEALDRLARNRRIDATLVLLEGGRAAELIEAAREEDPTAAIYVPASPRSEVPAGARPLPATTPAEILDALSRELSI